MLRVRVTDAHRISRYRLAATVLLLIGLLGAACGTTVPTVEPTRLTLAASSSAQPLAGELATAYHAAYPHVSIDLLPVASEAAAAQAVLAGRADAALATGQGAFPAGLRASHLATDALAIVVHPERPVDNLTGQQVREILQGLLRSWDELEPAADAAPIQIVAREQGSGSRLALTEALMGPRPLAPTALILPDDHRVRAYVASHRNALGILPAGWLNDQVRAVAIDGRGYDWVARGWPDYPLELPIHLLTGDAPQPEVLALASFLLGARGQQIVSRRYAPTFAQP